MNLKEEILRSSAIPAAFYVWDKVIYTEEAERIAESYAKEKVLEYAIYVAETINDCTLTPNENKNIEKDVNEWWEENK